MTASEEKYVRVWVGFLRANGKDEKEAWYRATRGAKKKLWKAIWEIERDGRDVTDHQRHGP